ncbi:hypothetical protein AB1399_07010 [Hydrogenibacillus schlegelii]|uniref:Uncharacterized protein n=1 Tax=Hydrogenibacillus schlegelii TaxID=1484 RepID=A0A132MIP1_HYDSH|nr:hypothetical protein [Hydrogenibacillus schlegelii]KWW97291.1 hypothetical protein TR75_09490 [Hydrogenibacillus schlegelii]OAR05561.1 hypothetical protein SA87_11840 [Hydrogenibacillus schlegelii]
MGKAFRSAWTRGVSILLATSLGMLSGSGVFAEEQEGQTTVTDHETVYALLDAAGSVQKTIVVDWLHVKGHGRISVRDAGPLENITNLSGREMPTVQGDAIVWTLDVDGEHDLFYSGETSKALPVEAAIAYTLNGQPVEAKELAGKDGRVKIEVHLQNKLKQARSNPSVDEKGGTRTAEKERYTPFLALVNVNIPVDRFRDVQTGEAMTVVTGKTMSATWMVVPDPEATVTVEMTGNHIELDPITITLIPGIPPMPTMPVDPAQMEKLAEGIEDLASALAELDRGSAQLPAGIRQMKSGLTELAEGLKQLESVSDAHAAVLDELLSSHEQLIALAQGLKAKTASLQNPELQASLDALLQGLQKEKEALTLLKQGGTWQGRPFPSLKALQDGLRASREGATQLTGAADQAASGADRLAAAVRRLSGGTATMDRELRAGLGQWNEAQARMEALQSLAAAYDTFIGKPDGAKGDVRFILKSEAIQHPKEKPAPDTQAPPATPAAQPQEKQRPFLERIWAFFSRLFQR